jgi:hypothetical protein
MIKIITSGKFSKVNMGAFLQAGFGENAKGLAYPSRK